MRVFLAISFLSTTEFSLIQKLLSCILITVKIRKITLMGKGNKLILKTNNNLFYPLPFPKSIFVHGIILYELNPTSQIHLD